MNDEEQRVFEALTDEFMGITWIMKATKIPYYICISVLRDLERQGVAESKQIGMTIKWRKSSVEGISEANSPILEETSLC